MSNVTYIIRVPSERLSGLSGKTSYDATGNPISLDKAIKDPPPETTKNRELKKSISKTATREDVEAPLPHAARKEDTEPAPSDQAEKELSMDHDNENAAEEESSESNDEDPDSSDDDDGDEEELTDDDALDGYGMDDASDSDGPDEFEDFKWLKSIYGEAMIPDDSSDKKSKKIASCVSKLIHRRRIRGTFYADMEEPSQDTSAVAFDLFDRYGCLKRELIEHPVKKGSGLWGKELDEGDFLLIESVTVEKDHQRQGIATKLANKVWGKARKLGRSVSYALVWATHLNTSSYRLEASYLSDVERKASFDRSQARAVAFWRSLGYRRIGSTQWFCLAADPKHPSHNLAANDDWDPPVHEVPAEDGRELKDIYPIHYKIDHSNDFDAMNFLQQRLLSFPASDPSWSKVDREGKSIVHYAAECSKPHTLRWMLDQPFGPELLFCRNHAGETPLEALEIVLEAERVKKYIQLMIIPVSDRFQGFKKESVACLILLRGMSKPSDMDIIRVAFGCTCGECIEGFVSPRMAFALLCQAEIKHDLLNADVGELAGPMWCEWHDHYFQHMLPHVRANLVTNKSLRQGFTNMFDHIATCLRSKQAPTTENVLAALDAAGEWPPCTKNFLQRGGSVASAVLQVLDFAMDQDEMIGDGEHQSVFQEDIDKLKECRNDNEWGFVRRLCGFADEREYFGMGSEAELGPGTGMGGPQVLGKRTHEEETGESSYGVSKRAA